MQKMSVVPVDHLIKLDGDNYPCWKNQIKNVLIASDLMEVVDKSLKKPMGDDATRDNGKLLKEFTKKNASAYVILTATMQEKQMKEIAMYELASDIWDNLEFIYEEKSERNGVFLQQNFDDCERSPSESASEWVAQPLGDVGEAVSDSRIVAKILNGLVPKFETFIDVMEQHKFSVNKII